MTVYTHIDELITLAGVVVKDGRRPSEDDLGIIRNGAMIVGDKQDGADFGKVMWVGPRSQFSKAIKSLRQTSKRKTQLHEIRLNAPAVLPAFADCHTHLVFAGDRAHEFELRNQGATYQQIAARGGGIRYTVQQTRTATTKQLLELASNRLRRLQAQGVTTVEIKSGYGLSERDEIRILEVIKKLKESSESRIVATYLGPHAVPPDTASGASDSRSVKAAYWCEIMTSTLQKIKSKGLADRVDIFVEENYYTLDEAREYLTRARELGIAVTVHADQLTRTGASLELAKMGAQSVDHCVQISETDIQALARTDTVCVLLPASDFYLKMKYPPARALIDAGARVALASDYNPGTSPTLDLSFVGVLARLEMRMSQVEVLAALTYNSARALGLANETGALQPGFSADFVVLGDNWRRLFYEIGHHPVQATYCHGRRITRP